jgi:hypothetical protein
MNIVFLEEIFVQLEIQEMKYLPGISLRRSFKNRLLVCKRIKRRISTGHVLKSVFPVWINSAIYFPTPPATAIPFPFVPEATK